MRNDKYKSWNITYKYKNNKNLRSKTPEPSSKKLDPSIPKTYDPKYIVNFSHKDLKHIPHELLKKISEIF